MEQTIEQKLEALFLLQKIDSKFDEIVKLRGDLPDEVRDLEDEIIGFQTRIGKFTTENENLETEISNLKNNIKEYEKNIKKYEDQQSNVRNNREFDAISKEVELQKLDILIAEKRMKEIAFKIEQKAADIKFTTNTVEQRSLDLVAKKAELDVIIGESDNDEKSLVDESKKAESKIEARLLNSYKKLRGNYRNGLAVVMVKRDACGGCFNQVPPQRQAEVKEKRKIIVCEHCGRIFAGVETIIVPEAPAPIAKRGSIKEVKEA